MISFRSSDHGGSSAPLISVCSTGRKKVDFRARNARSQSDSLELKSRRLKHLINSVSLRSLTVIEEFPPALLRRQSSEAIISDWMRGGVLRGERSTSDELSKY